MEQPSIFSNANGRIIDVGLSDYEDAHRFQLELHSSIASGRGSEIIILTEHFPVYTCGRTTLPHERPQKGNIPIVDIERGGRLTYHGPGQIVGYPILSLARRKWSIPQYLRRLETSLMAALLHVGVEAQYRAEFKAGLWVGDKKLISIGIAVRHWTTFHGFSLNVDGDLEPFQKISPCGLSGDCVTSLKALGVAVSKERMREIVVQNLMRNFFE